MPDWPVLRTYQADALSRIALPLGGIGTGTISLGGRGDLRDFEVGNRPAKGFTPSRAFAALWCRWSGGTVCRAVEGALEPPYDGPTGARHANHGLPRFRHAEFRAAYPLAQVALADPDLPLTVRLEAFNPLVPGDVAASSLPVAVLRYVLDNPSPEPVPAAVCLSLPNFIGCDGTASPAKANRNESRDGAGLRGVAMRSDGVDPTSPAWGTLALASTHDGPLSRRTAWAKLTWGDSLLDFWDDLSDDGALSEREAGGVDDPCASLAAGLTVPAGGQAAVTFLLAWHFPNRYTWTPASEGACGPPDWLGNRYTTVFDDAWAAAEHAAAHLADLERRTVCFVRAVTDSDLPEPVREAALFNLSTLRSQTCFVPADGHLAGWEGCHDKQGCCHGSCTHVWNYEQATAYLFADLARSQREVEFLHATDAEGRMSFRVNLPLGRARDYGRAAADGQMGCLLKLYREWRLGGGDDWLRRLWPAARRALEFCWLPGGWDADGDGVMEGCQHNTMDVEYYGPNPQVQGWYLGALRAGEELARHLGQTEFADACHDKYLRGRAWTDGHLFNGEYYQHDIRPPGSQAVIAAGLRHSFGAGDLDEPELQLGAGCLVDQLVGQLLAHLCGLGHLLDPEHVRRALESVARYNWRGELYGHFNHLRSYALNDEAALLMASYPRGDRPRRPFPYFNEAMTGFEYTAAVGMLQEGLTDYGLRSFAAVRARYDGRRRNPFDEAECGHHYARAMVAWAGLLAWTGFHWSAPERTISFRAAHQPVTWFWSNGAAWGKVRQAPRDGGAEVTLTVLHGELALDRLRLDGAGTVDAPGTRLSADGTKAATWRVG